ncbi:hypothetical protein [Ornithinibacillus scapharcae]|uniref:hypothetical protein n=1 Tax=Ornithinibacillus scapharcae TaxID=1147159 RepID=UPI000225C046|nr:hypothetical protein [Ornithinibacillus scapharcae]
MENRNFPYIIAIAAVSGGGKTTIATKLADKLDKSKVLYFDDYEFDGPSDIMDWVDNGTNYDDWDLTPLVTDLKLLITEKLNYIVLDYPMAYKNSHISNFIDLAVFIDTPLDIALARRIHRDYQQESSEKILDELTFYLTHGRRGYLEMLRTIKSASDEVVDGSKSIAEITDNIAELILQKVENNNVKHRTY